MARIRTLKPDAWHDGRLARSSRDARLLWTVLITMADDEGRFRASKAIVYGHGYPEDEDALSLIPAWLDELSSAGLVVLYEAGGEQFGHFPKWGAHQRINKPTPSRIPGPPRYSPNFPGENPREVEVEVEYGSGGGGGGGGGTSSLRSDVLGARAAVADAPGDPVTPGEDSLRSDDRWPKDIAPSLLTVAERVREGLHRVAAEKRGRLPSRRAICRVLADFPGHDHARIVGEFEHYWLHGGGERTKRRDIVRTYRARCEQLVATLPTPSDRAGREDRFEAAARRKRRDLGMCEACGDRRPIDGQAICLDCGEAQAA